MLNVVMRRADAAVAHFDVRKKAWRPFRVIP